MFRKLVGWTFMATVVLTAAVHAKAKKITIRKKTYTYKMLKDDQGLQADVYRVADDSVRPVVIWLHGGALIMGNRNLSPQAGTLEGALLKAGYAVVSIDYRMAPHVKLPIILKDVQDACAWVRGKGPKLFHIDPNRIAVAGGSAGGYLTLMTGFIVKPRPRALVSLWGYGDIDGAWYSKPDPFYRKQPLVSREEADKQGGGKLYLYLRQQGLWPRKLTGHDPASKPQAFDPFCPIRNVSKKYPPTLLVHGDKDTDVPYEQSVAMAGELKRKGVEHQFIPLPGVGHGFGKADAKVVARTYARVVAFLDKHLQ